MNYKTYILIFGSLAAIIGLVGFLVSGAKGQIGAEITPLAALPAYDVECVDLLERVDNGEQLDAGGTDSELNRAHMCFQGFTKDWTEGTALYEWNGSFSKDLPLNKVIQAHIQMSKNIKINKNRVRGKIYVDLSDSLSQIKAQAIKL